MKSILSVAIALAVSCAAIVPGHAADHQVKMLNSGEKGRMVFEPDLIRAEVGDTVTFLPTDPGHNAASIDGMLPEGAESFRGGINKEVKVTISQEGVYGVKCTPHYGMGMVALIVAGEPVNLDEARAVKQPGTAKAKFEELFSEYEAGQ